MKTFVLLQPGDMELERENVITATGNDRSALLYAVWIHFAAELKYWVSVAADSNVAYTQDEKTALVEMIERHEDFSVGFHELPPVEPYWSPWYLIIV